MQTYNSFSELGIHIFNLFNEVPFKTEATVPQNFRPVVDLIYDSYHYPHPTYHDATLELPAPAPETHSAIASFTSGKDSVYIAIELVKAGYLPELYYMTNANPTVSSRELSAAHSCVDAINETFNVSLKLEEIPFDATFKGGNRIFPEDSVAPGQLLVENPFKNQYILCKHLDRAMSIGCRYICQGNHASDFIKESLMTVSFTDVIELYNCFEECVNKYYQVKLGNIPHEMTYTKIIDYLSHYPKVFAVMSSCVAANYRFKQWKGSVTKRFPKMRFLPGRCGVCHKCRSEVISLAILGKVYDVNDPDVRAYLKDCFRYLSNNVVSYNYRHYYSPDLPLNTLLGNFLKYGII